MTRLHDLRRFTLDRFSGVGAEETFAIGDVHGRADLLDRALDAIAAVPPAPGRTRRLVTTGDYIDRGPEGVRAIDILMGAEARLGFPVTCLSGNHEQMLLATLDEDLPPHRCEEISSIWLGNGGLSVISELVQLGHALRPLTQAAVAAALGPDRIAFLRGLALSHRPEGGDVLFVHAGLHPDVPTEEFLSAGRLRPFASDRFRESLDPCWIRGPFLSHRPSEFGQVGHHGLFVVHGHTPQDGLDRSQDFHVSHDRINLDTYAVGTGRLRVARLVGNVLETFEVRMGSEG